MLPVLVFDADDNPWGGQELLQQLESDVEAALDLHGRSSTRFRQRFIDMEEANTAWLGWQEAAEEGRFGMVEAFGHLADLVQRADFWRR